MATHWYSLGRYYVQSALRQCWHAVNCGRDDGSGTGNVPRMMAEASFSPVGANSDKLVAQ